MLLPASANPWSLVPWIETIVFLIFQTSLDNAFEHRGLAGVSQLLSTMYLLELFLG